MPGMLKAAALSLALTATLIAPAYASPQTEAEMSMPQPAVHTFTSFDGTVISYQTLGEGPPVLLLHGFSGNAEVNWFGPGIAQKIAAAGYMVIAPDLRGHGASPVADPDAPWPRDAIARDQIALAKHLGQKPYGVVGYSMGALSALRYHLLSRDGERLILGGIGDAAAEEANTDRNTAFRAALDAAIAGEDTPSAKAMKARAKATGGNLEGFRAALAARLYTGRDLLETFALPTLVLTGDQDLDNGSGPKLAEIIPEADYVQLSGTHLSAVGDPAFPKAIIAFLNAGR